MRERIKNAYKKRTKKSLGEKQLKESLFAYDLLEPYSIYRVQYSII